MSLFQDRPRHGGETRITAFQVLTAAVFLWLLSGFWDLQVNSPEFYAERAEQNRIKSLPLAAPRGKILDRDGRVLVDNTPAVKVLLSRTAFSESRLPVIAEGLNMPLDRLRGKLGRLRKSNAPEYQAAVLKENLTRAEVAFVESHKAQLPELELMLSHRRRYPRRGLASHVAGYVGEINDRELEQLEFINYEPGAEVGKAGLERQYNDVLSGTGGSRLVVVDSRGRERGVLGVQPAKPGRSIRTTLDLDLQVVAELAMEGRKGAVVALDPRNGEVLAFVSAPNYDPNQFVGGISSSDWRELASDPDRPLMNRVTQAQLAPGSIFKPIVAWAAYDSGAAGDSHAAVCTGGASHYGRYFRCHRAAGHGTVSLYGGLVHSCDVYFYSLGARLGIDRIAEYARRAGLGAPTGIDLPGEKDGVVPSRKWKLRFYREKWYAGETISVAIGQGALTVTPLQITHALGGLVLGGEWHRPHLVPYDEMHSLFPEFEPPAPRRAEVDPGHADRIRQALWGVVNDSGTGVRARIPGYEVCGKTGTAQVVSSRTEAKSGEEKFADNAWFVGFAPCHEPEIIVTALYQHGEHGHLAAPIVRDVIKAYFDKQQRLRGKRPDFTRLRPPAEPLGSGPGD